MGSEDLVWSEEKEELFDKACADFTANNRRIPTAEEEAEIWEIIYHMKDKE